MNRQTEQPDSFILTIDGGLFAAGFAVGVILAKLVIRNTLLAVAFGTGLGLAVATSPQLQERMREDWQRSRQDSFHERVS